MTINYAYFDYAASTPVDPAVMVRMGEVAGLFGNPSAVHGPGRELRSLVDVARRQAADFLGVKPREIIFTSGATEANNTAVIGWWREIAGRKLPAGVRFRVITSSLEHASVSQAIASIGLDGAEIIMLPVSREGLVNEDDLKAALNAETVLVTLPWVNNVFGTRQPVEEFAAAVRVERQKRGPAGLPIAFHCDAVQAARFEKLDPVSVGMDFLSLSAHKIYGPKGVGCLWVREGFSVGPLVLGGGQESGRRSGTENVTGIVGFGLAAEIMGKRRAQDARDAEAVRGLLEPELATRHGMKAVGSVGSRVPGIVFMTDRRQSGDERALRLDAAGVAVSTGSACHAGSRRATELAVDVLGDGEADRGGVRISWGRFTRDEDVRRLLESFGR